MAFVESLSLTYEHRKTGAAPARFISEFRTTTRSRSYVSEYVFRLPYGFETGERPRLHTLQSHARAASASHLGPRQGQAGGC